MDPVSIASAAATAANALFVAAKLIETFRRAVAVVDQSVTALESLSRGLAGVLQSLHKALEDPILNESKNAECWLSVHDSITSCESTVKELDVKLAPLSQPGANPAQQAWRTARLSFQQPDIDRLVANMKTHSINLQLALQTVNVIIAASIPGAISADQTARFDRLERMIAALRRHIIEEPTAESAGDSLRPEMMMIADQNLSIVTINEDTRKLFISASTVVSGSVGGTIRSGSSSIRAATPTPQQPAFEDFASAALEIPIVDGSEAGVPQDDTQRRRIRSWERSVTTGRSSDSEDDSDEGLDDDLQFQIARSSFKLGMDRYKQEKFSEAREYLKVGIEGARALSDEQKIQLDLSSMQFHHALCCIVQSSLLEEAEKSFRLVAESSGSRENDARLQCFALYQLARVLLKMNKLRPAKKYCGRAIKNMKEEESIGKMHDAYFDSLRLLALIYWAEGSKFQAIASSLTLPTSHQIAEDAFDEELALILAVDDIKDFGSGNTSASLNEPTFTPQRSVNGEPSPQQSPSIRDSISIPPRSNSTATGLTIKTSFTGEGNRSSVASSVPARSNSAATVSTSATTSTNATSIPSIAGIERVYTNGGDQVEAMRIINSKGFRKQDVNKGISWAAAEGRLAVLDILLQDPLADINARRSGLRSAQDTPLMIAAAKGHLDICQRLLEAKAEVNIIHRGKSALDRAINAKFPDICLLLLEYGASPDCAKDEDMSPLALAAWKGDLTICQMLFDFKVDINENQFKSTKEERTALMLAAALNRVGVMEWLLTHGAFVDGPNPAVTTPLIEAARAGAVDACRFLLTHGANVNLMTRRRMTAKRAASTGWLQEFIGKWPESSNWQTARP